MNGSIDTRVATILHRLVERVAARLPQPRVIYDREGGTPYLSRYYILGAPIGEDGGSAFDAAGNPRSGAKWRDGGIGLYLHRFHRGDQDEELHNHPWQWSVSLILAGGYFEERRHGSEVHSHEYRPGSINVIMADTFHRVDLRERDAWSLFLAGPRAQSWGFWNRVTDTFTPWREHLARKRADAHDAKYFRGTGLFHARTVSGAAASGYFVRYFRRPP